MREKVELLLTGTEKGDVKITFDNVEKLDNYIETLITMRDDLAERIEIAKAKKRANRKMKKVKSGLEKTLDAQISELDKMYVDFCNEFDSLSKDNKEKLKSYKNFIDMLYELGKDTAMNWKQNIK